MYLVALEQPNVYTQRETKTGESLRIIINYGINDTVKPWLSKFWAIEPFFLGPKQPKFHLYTQCAHSYKHSFVVCTDVEARFGHWVPPFVSLNPELTS